VNRAIAKGFCTVSIDRFGIGNSSHGDPLNLVQAPAEVSATYEISKMLRAGTFPTISHKFQKVVHVGHSFGSVQTLLLSAQHPEVTDGIVLTGWSANGTWLGQTIAGWNLHLARLNQPLRFGGTSTIEACQPSLISQEVRNSSSDTTALIAQALASVGINLNTQEAWEETATTELGDVLNGINATSGLNSQDLPTGYLTWADWTSNQFAFLYPPYYDLSLALYAERTKQPVTLGELFTLANGVPSTTSFSGPVMVLTGREDTIFCGGDCLATGGSGANIPGMAQSAFPNASVFEAYIQPNTGCVLCYAS